MGKDDTSGGPSRAWSRDYESSTDSATNTPVSWAYQTDPFWKAKRELVRLAEEREKAERKQRRRQKGERLQRQGKGHDPRRQVIARTRVQGRGRGRR